MNAHWYRRIEHDGKYEEEEGYMDEFRDLLDQDGKGQAEVEMSTTFSIDYSAVKVVASVRVTCRQDAETINKTGERAFLKSLEFAKDGLSHAIPAKDDVLRSIYGGG